MTKAFQHETGDREVIKPIEEFYVLISGDQNGEREWHAISELFAGGATLSVARNSEPARFLTMNVREYLARLSDYLSDKNFYEKGSNFDVFISNDIASVRSVYQARMNQESGESEKSGVNLVQLVREEGRWRILSMLWQADP